jgi:hypothetical protein
LTITHLDLTAFRQLTLGLSFNFARCAEVLDAALVSLNEQTGFVDRMRAWIAAGAFEGGPGPYAQPRVIVDVTETRSVTGQHGYFATVLQNHEREQAPVVFISMRSPTLDVPMRVEVPLRAVLIGNPPIEGRHTVYLHALMTDRGDAHVYYGITKRGWNLRFDEHTRAAVACKSQRRLGRTLNDLIDARVAELSGKPDDRPRLAAIITDLCATGLSHEQALEIEEYLVDKYSLASKHPLGLNMIPGGKAGIAHARRFKQRRR